MHGQDVDVPGAAACVVFDGPRQARIVLQAGQQGLDRGVSLCDERLDNGQAGEHGAAVHDRHRLRGRDPVEVLDQGRDPGVAVGELRGVGRALRLLGTPIVVGQQCGRQAEEVEVGHDPVFVLEVTGAWESHRLGPHLDQRGDAGDLPEVGQRLRIISFLMGQ